MSTYAERSAVGNIVAESLDDMLVHVTLFVVGLCRRRLGVSNATRERGRGYAAFGSVIVWASR